MEKVIRTCYIITAPDGKFLYDIWRGAAFWTTAAHYSVGAGQAWLNHDTAAAKLKEARSALGRDDLNLTLVTIAKRDLDWVLVSQRGVAA
jgi:hypothetical protein